MNKTSLEKRVLELEKRIEELESRQSNLRSRQRRDDMLNPTDKKEPSRLMK